MHKRATDDPLVLEIARRFTWETQPRLSAPCVTREHIFASDGRALFMARNPGLPPSAPNGFPRADCEEFAATARAAKAPFASVTVADLLAALYREVPAERRCEERGDTAHAEALLLFPCEPWLSACVENVVISYSGGERRKMLVTAHWFGLCVKALSDLGEDIVKLCRFTLTKKQAAKSLAAREPRPLIFVGERARIILMPRTKP